jgi:tellurite methyltransferase
VLRRIIDFHLDAEGDWVAEMSCYHNRHIRHDPPFKEAAWVLDPAGRDAHVGSNLECPLCDRAELPEGLSVVGHAGPWDQDSLPGGLLHSHRVPEGRWGLLRVTEGAIDFQFEPAGAPPVHLEAGHDQPIPPGAPHRLIPTGAVRLQLEFLGRPVLHNLEIKGK